MLVPLMNITTYDGEVYYWKSAEHICHGVLSLNIPLLLISR
jgi:hypothetical protein